MTSSRRSHRERIKARGHENVSSKHETTLMFTKDDYLTPKGDCIVAIEADKAIADLNDSFLRKLKDKDTEIEIIIESQGIRDKVIARGDEDLILSDGEDMVIRKSDYICERTLAINADKAACDLKRELIERIAAGAIVSVFLRLS